MTYCQSPVLSAMETLLPIDDAYKWNLALRGLLESNRPTKALLGYSHMRRRGIRVDSHTLVLALKACCTLFTPGLLLGQQVHAHVPKLGFQSNTIIKTSLLQLYALSGSLPAAQKVFDETPQRDTALWNALIAAYSQRSHPHKAILAARSMVAENVRPNELTVVSVLSACSQLRALAEGRLVHGYAIKNLVRLDTFVHNALIDVYSKCGCLFMARMLFERLRHKNAVSWTAMINGYTDGDSPVEALALFREMELAEVRPDEVAVLGVLSMCSRLGSSELGEWVDEFVERNRFGASVKVSNALIDMHCRCGNLERSCRIFEHMVDRSLVTWSAMIRGLAMHGHGIAALVRLAQMQRAGFRPDRILFISAIIACSHAGLVVEGSECFRSMVEDYGLVPWMEHYGGMVDLFCRAGLVEEAFAFVVRMPVKPDAAILRALVGACRDQGNAGMAKKVMDWSSESEPEDSGSYVLRSNLKAMMGEWGGVEEVRKEMEIRGVRKKDPGRSFVESDVKLQCKQRLIHSLGC